MYLAHMVWEQDGSCREQTLRDHNRQVGQYASSCLKKAGLPIGADQTVVGLAYGYGKTYVEKKQYDQARYYLQIAYDLTHAQEVKEMLIEMKN